MALSTPLRPSEPPSESLLPSPSEVRCLVGGGGTCSWNGEHSIVISFPRAATPLGTLATIKSLTSVSQEFLIPGAIGDLRFLDALFQVSVVGPTGSPITFFTPPMDLWISYSDRDLARVGDSGGLLILQYDFQGRAWMSDTLAPTVDVGQGQVHLSVSQAGVFGLFGKMNSSGAKDPIPTGGSNGDWISRSLNGLIDLIRRLLRDW